MRGDDEIKGRSEACVIGSEAEAMTASRTTDQDRLVVRASRMRGGEVDRREEAWRGIRAWRPTGEPEAVYGNAPKFGLR